MAQEITMIAVLKNGNRTDLDAPEFVGDGLRNLDDARDAAQEALDYIGVDCEAVEIHADGELVETVGR